MMVDDEQRLRDAQLEYLNFLDDEEDQGVYTNHVKDMISEGSRRILVNINDLRRKNVGRAQALLRKADEEILAFNRALKEFIASIQPDLAKVEENFYVGFDGCFGDRYLTPRTLTSKYIGSLLCVEGIVTKVSLVRPKIMHSVHYCPATKKIIERKHSDLLSLEGATNRGAYPTKDEDGNLLETEFGLSVYRDHQVITLQEMPENSPAGQLPRSVDIICDDDLVDQCKPGDRIKAVASYRCIPSKNGGFTSGTFQAVLIANSIAQMNKETDLSISREEVNLCKKLAKDSDIFELLSKSLAPSIHGQHYVKKAILCLLLGGTEKNLMNGTRLRGDINILLIGDPSVAKSQLLRYVLLIAPRAIPTTGRGSSGVGLTAAVTTDQETGERKLEAGAMVLADRGVVCIDEFDKMSDIDRTAIHEVMEQGRVTISKAGIHASLNARCSVLAAANPVYGKYDQYKTPMENIGLQDSLLTRFDLLFVMLDNIDKENDKTIADHVVRMHRYRNPLEQDGEVTCTGSSYEDTLSMANNVKEEKQGIAIYEKYNASLHGKLRSKSEKVLTVDFMRKYIHIAKCLKPKLSEQACEVIANEYSRLRTQEIMESNVMRTQPVTVRTLETLIRLATAHAKARLSNIVTSQDAKIAIELVQYAYFKKVLEKEKRKRNRDDEDDSSKADDNETTDSEPASTTKRHKPEDTMLQDSEETTTDIVDRDEAATPAKSRRLESTTGESKTTRSSTQTISKERLEIFKTNLSSCFRKMREQSLPKQTLVEHINENVSDAFSEGEIDAAISQMTEDNQIMLADGVVFLI
ncbi:unnamed protein product [Hermetia illucens]|uniref:DNA replication licensing factor MCM3 n=1 Tax=Hermetia illucens TaxID=343691 RepID=A0A7R8UAU7_HERIL|nr:DNA replication licensing factor Mcm3 [Hermetia illucens]CAD7077331.1 unnamed protein product [Hermetia illucens]